MRALRFLVRVALSPHEAGKLRAVVTDQLREILSLQWANIYLNRENTRLTLELEELRSEP